MLFGKPPLARGRLQEKYPTMKADAEKEKAALKNIQWFKFSN
jgi:hypothetical protein